jgi:hypothetical protein
MNELLLVLLAWIGKNTDYDVEYALPNIVMTEPYNMCSNYGISDKGQCEAAKLVGFYDKELTIYLKTGFERTSKTDTSRLVHELIHYVQWKNGVDKNTCLGKLEVEAYELQDQWLVELGLEPRSDPFRMIMLEASCDA